MSADTVSLHILLINHNSAMKKLLLSTLWILLSIIIAKSETVHVSTPGTLQELVSSLENSAIKELTVSGKLDGSDIYYLNSAPDNISGLETLDISEVELIPGEICYGTARKSVGYKENIVTCYFFISEENKTEYSNSVTDMLGTTHSAWKVYCNDLQYAFTKTNIKKIVFPNCLTSLGEGICYYSYLEEAVAGPNVTRVGDKAFYTWSTLKSFTGGKIENFGEYSFINNTNLKSIDLSHAKIIGDNAFDGCSITKVSLPEGLQSVGYRAFPDVLFSNVVFPASLVSIDRYSFSSSGANLKYEDGVYYVNNIAVMPSDKTTEIIFRTGTRFVANHFGASKVTSVVFNEELDSIGCNAFYGAPLTNVVLPSIYKIGNEAFRECSALKTVIANLRLPEYIGINAFSECTELNSFKVLTNDTRECVIADAAFYNCSALQEFKFPNETHFSYIGSRAFYNCKMLNEIELNDVDYIGSYTFYNCGTVMKFPHSVYEIGAGAFSGVTCYSVYIGPNIKVLEEGIFRDIKGLRKIRIDAECLEDGKDRVFYNSVNLLNTIIIGPKVHYIPYLCLKTESGGGGGKVDITFMDRDPSCLYDDLVLDGTFAGCNIKSVTLPDYVVLRYNAFRSTSLEEVLYSGAARWSETQQGTSYGDREIDHYVFAGCSNLSRLELAPSISKIDENNFSSLGNLRVVSVYRATPPVYSEGFHNDTYQEGVLLVPAGCVERYRSTAPWSNFVNIAEIGSAQIYVGSRFEIGDLRYEITDADPDNPKAKVIGLSADGSDSYRAGNSPYSDAMDKELVIPSEVVYAGKVCTVEGIGEGAFQSEYFEGVLLPSTIRYIEEDAFYNYTDRRSTRIEVPDIATWLNIDFEMPYCSPLAYNDNSLMAGGELVTDLVLPEDAIVKNYAFYCYNGLKTLTIPASVISVADWSFRGCHNLSKIIVEDSEHNVPVSFVGTQFTGLEEIYLGSNCKFNAFGNQASLKKVVVGSKVKELSSSLFSGCFKLKEVELPRSISTIESGVFNGCKQIELVTCRAATPPAYEGGFDSETYQKAVLYVPAGCADHYRSAEPWSNFSNIMELDSTEVYVGYRFQVGDLMYEVTDENQSNLKVKVVSSVVPGSEINSMDNRSYPDFMDKDLVIPSEVIYGDKVCTVEGIGENAFAHTYLRSISLPASIKYVERGAFSNFTDHRSTRVEVPDMATWLNIDFSDVLCSPLVYNGDSLMVGGELIVDLVLPQNAVVKEGAFSHYKSLKTLTIPASVVSVADNAFIGCRNLEKIVIEDSDRTLSMNISNYNASLVSLTEVYLGSDCEGNTFDSALNLKKVTIGPKVRRLSDGIFKNCASLTEVEFSPALTHIGNYAFSGTGLTEVRIPDGVEVIGDYAFSTKLHSVSLPESLRVIGNGAFSGASLTQVKLPDGLCELGSWAFNGTNLTQVNIPKGIDKLNPRVFSGTNLRMVVIPGNVKSVEQSAFYSCNSLNEVWFEQGVEAIREGAFEDCLYLTTVLVPHTMNLMERASFAGCYRINTIICKATTPPESNNLYAKAFEQNVYDSGQLLVPPGYANAYRNIPYSDSRWHWSQFNNIMESELAGIGDVMADGDGVAVRVEDGRIVVDGVPEGSVVEVYDVAGRQVYRGTGDIPRLTHGVYMVRVGTRVAKVRV